MREILFRAKRVDNGAWIEGDLLHPLNAETQGYYIVPIGCALHRMTQVAPATVGQYSTVDDKNGTKAFDGSRVKYVSSDGLHTVYGTICFGEIPQDFGTHANHIGFYIEWDSDGANEWNEWWRHDLTYWLKEEGAEVIDNPELLEVSHD